MSESPSKSSFTLIISCPDEVGIVAAICQFIAQRGGSLIESNQHTDVEQGWFYLRNVIDGQSLSIDENRFREEFAPLADKFSMEWYLRDNSVPQRVAIMASHSSHCLADLLHRWKSNELNCTIPCVISNHENLRSMVEWHGIPFHHVPVPKEDKSEAFEKTANIIERHQAETIVLARYMQIIPPAICSSYSGRLINIHHSFLPSFIGANPYQKAYDRGVKLIGATAHFVTTDLDEGPIIEQAVERVDHTLSPDQLTTIGNEIESVVLNRAVQWHAESRVFEFGNRTVVLR